MLVLVLFYLHRVKINNNKKTKNTNNTKNAERIVKVIIVND